MTADLDFEASFTTTTNAPTETVHALPGIDAPTTAQLRFIANLRTDWQSAETSLAKLAGREPRRPAWVDPATKRAASEMIDKGIAARDLIEAELTGASKAVKSRPAATVEDGMYLVGETVYKVQLAGSGHLYAKRLVRNGDEWSWGYAAGALGLIAREGRKMSLEEAEAFGKLYGVCCRCGATLTDETSIERGIGPVCASKF